MISINCKHIATVQHNIGNGITEPKLAFTDDNISVVIKTNNGPEGTLVLFNELFCYRLAILLNIKMPISGVCLIDEHTRIYNDCVKRNQSGYAFYSTYLNKSVTLIDSIIPMIQNKKDFWQILLFDHIIFNPDRNPGNLLVQYYKNNITLYAIDHSHVFINQAIWDSSCLKRAIQENDYLSSRILKENSYLYEMFFRHLNVSSNLFSNIITYFRNQITPDALYNIISNIPVDWLPSKQDIDTLIEYILYRLDHLEDICITILNYING